MAGYRRGLRLPGSVVVVAGAPGAIMAATARALARRGARPVLVGLPGDALAQAAGAPASGVEVTDPDAVRDAAQRAVARCGRLDGWVQVAAPDAPSTSGTLLDRPPAATRRTLEVAVLGAVHGARAALPLMAAGGGGVLVVVVSVHGQVARPLAAPESMSGAALRAMAGALRQELRLTGVRGVAVTTVLAPGVDPAGRPSTSPQRVAATVLGRLRRPGLEKVAGGPVVTALVHGHALVPPVSEWLVARWARQAVGPAVDDGADDPGGRPGIENPW